jgi:hypothetical protein
MLWNGAVMDFNTTPATFICDDNGDIGRFSFAISDNKGEILLFGYKKNNSNTSLTDFVVKNSKQEVIITEQCNDLKNIVYCKHPDGGYYLAVVYFRRLIGTLCIYKFDGNGNLTHSYRYDKGYYKSFLVMLPYGNDVKLLAYNNEEPSSIESYRLASDGVFLEKTFEADLGHFGLQPYVPFDICQTLDGSKIFAYIHCDFFIIDIDSKSGDISVSKMEVPGSFVNMALSPNDKYLLSIRNNQLVGYDITRELDLSKYEMLYDFSSEVEYTSSGNWHLQIGIDGKIYAAKFSANKLFVIDGIETGNIIVEKIDTGDYVPIPNVYKVFPQIMRRPNTQENPCDGLKTPKIICE